MLFPGLIYWLDRKNINAVQNTTPEKADEQRQDSDTDCEEFFECEDDEETGGFGVRQERERIRREGKGRK